MKTWTKTLFAVVLGAALAGAAAADTLELRDGRVLQGKYLGGTQATLRFEVNGEVQAFFDERCCGVDVYAGNEPATGGCAASGTRCSGSRSSGGCAAQSYGFGARELRLRIGNDSRGAVFTGAHD